MRLPLKLFDPLYAEKFRLVRVEIFPVADSDTREPRGVAILKSASRFTLPFCGFGTESGFADNRIWQGWRREAEVCSR